MNKNGRMYCRMNLNQDLSIFEKILNKEIPATTVYEDEYTLAFKDIVPQAPVHVLVILKTKKFVNVNDAETEEDALLLGRVLLTAKKVAKLCGIDKDGYRLIINNGAQAQQTVHYLHCHVMGGREMSWPPG